MGEQKNDDWYVALQTTIVAVFVNGVSFKTTRYIEDCATVIAC